jgi:translation initiation factor 2 gamma subunit (eIF-2gamma)
VILGTAGHVDLGKTTLVRALTGASPTGWPRSAGAA